jgi:glucokinase
MAEVSDVVAAVDVGGTRIKAALVTAAYDTRAAVTTPTPKDIAVDIGAVVHATVTDLLAMAAQDDRQARLVGCGIVVPGLVDEAGGVGLLSVNLGWRELPIRDPVASVLGVPTVVGHDVRAGLLAETRLGAARGAQHALFLPVGTGIAGALLLDGAVVTADGRAGELGHLVIDPAGPPCGCGATGCLEVIASAAAIEREYAARTGVTAAAEEVAVRASAGDPDAAEVWARAVAALAQAIVATVTITGVDLVLIGGGLAESGAVLLDPLRAAVASRLTFQRPPRLERAAFGARAGCLGAACLAWDRAVIPRGEAR